MRKLLYLRDVKKSDINILLSWANDPIVRQNSFNSDHISFETHQRWFNNMMCNEKQQQYILMNNETPIGQVRLTINEAGDAAEIGYSISTDYRGKGYGKVIIELIKDKIKSEYPEIKKLVARVKNGNIASEKCFLNTGFEKIFVQYEMIV